VRVGETSIKNGGLKGIKADCRGCTGNDKDFEGVRHDRLDAADSQQMQLLVHPFHPP